MGGRWNDPVVGSTLQEDSSSWRGGGDVPAEEEPPGARLELVRTTSTIKWPAGGGEGLSHLTGEEGRWGLVMRVSGHRCINCQNFHSEGPRDSATDQGNVYLKLHLQTR